MKNSKIIMEKGAALVFLPFIQEQQQAKSGIVEISDEGVTSAELDAIAESDPSVAKASTVLRQALQAVTADLGAIVKVSGNTLFRKVAIIDQAHVAAAYTAGNAASGTSASGVVTPDDSEATGPTPHSNSVADGTGYSTVINAFLATRKPDITPAQLIDALEDEAMFQWTENEMAQSFLVFIDQTGKVTKVLDGETTEIDAAYDDALGVSGLVLQKEYSITVPSPSETSGRQYGE